MEAAATHVYKSAGGCDVKLDTYPAADGNAAPVLVWIHGGALMGGGREQMRAVLRDMLHEAGFAQCSIDYRLAPETKLPEIIADVHDALAWVATQGPQAFGADPARLAVLGGSAGGYLSLMCGTFSEHRPKAIVSYYGYGDIVGDWYAKPDPFYCNSPAVPEQEARSVVGTACISNAEGANERFRFYLYCRQHGLWPREVMGVPPDEHPEVFAPYCPLQQVNASYPPTLLFHGTADTDVPYEQSALMNRALQEAGVPHELVSVKHGAHGFDGGVKPEDIHAAEPSPAAASFLKTLRFLKDWV